MEAESENMESMQELSQPIQARCFLSDVRIQTDEANTEFGQKLLMHGSEAGGKTSKQLFGMIFVC